MGKDGEYFYCPMCAEEGEQPYKDKFNSEMALPVQLQRREDGSWLVYLRKQGPLTPDEAKHLRKFCTRHGALLETVILESCPHSWRPICLTSRYCDLCGEQEEGRIVFD